MDVREDREYNWIMYGKHEPPKCAECGKPIQFGTVDAWTQGGKDYHYPCRPESGQRDSRTK